ncbi:hypothetical protein KEHDKFFH_09620 [Marinobacter maroccanus]|uniref:Uncharacterized protein n=1 Tax=Marinobacter maroccanus TaxID=2055143 RepID=A0A2S5ZBE7_9GAMM|nr:hypothetical protein KEHDKFFH_09620 [Marinobacter maroccanus]
MPPVRQTNHLSFPQTADSLVQKPVGAGVSQTVSSMDAAIKPTWTYLRRVCDTPAPIGSTPKQAARRGQAPKPKP